MDLDLLLIFLCRPPSHYRARAGTLISQAPSHQKRKRRIEEKTCVLPKQTNFTEHSSIFISGK